MGEQSREVSWELLWQRDGVLTRGQFCRQVRESVLESGNGQCTGPGHADLKDNDQDSARNNAPLKSTLAPFGCRGVW